MHYTSAVTYGNKILVRGYHEGKPFAIKVDYKPTMFVDAKKSNEEPVWSLLDGSPVYPVVMDSIKGAKEFVERYEGVHGFNVYGHPKWEFQYLSDTYTKDIHYDVTDIRVFYLDIETTVDHGFPEYDNPLEQVTLISVRDSKRHRIKTWGYKPYKGDDKSFDYTYCKTEEELFLSFQQFWVDNYPDIITGWNSNSFDIPYLFKRIEKVLGPEYLKKFSPWGVVRERTFSMMNREEMQYTISGIACLDYLELYKKYTYTTQESYKLDHIAFVELGKRKLENLGKNFKDSYTNFFDEFVRYNTIDVSLVVELEAKMKLIELAIAVAYRAKVNFDDVFSPIKLWENIAYNHLKKEKRVPPNKTHSIKDEKYEGAYVKESIVGKHKWVASFDLQSLYPHLIMMYNISPETLLDKVKDCTVDQLLDMSVDTTSLVEDNFSMTANGYAFRKDIKGFLPSLMEEVYNSRSIDKKAMLKIEQEYETTKNKELLKDISRLNNAQMASKILLNSAYGALGAPFFLYYDIRMAEGITSSGQLAIRWVAKRINEKMNSILDTDNKDYIIASDTDSVYLSLEKLVEKSCIDKTDEQKIKFIDKVCEQVIRPVINKAYEDLASYMNVYKNAMFMKREALADTAIFVGKKRYIMSVHNSEGVQYKTPKLKIMGLEMVKSSTPSEVKAKLKEAVPILLYKDQKDLHGFVEEFKQNFDNLSPFDISFPRSVKGLEKYTGPHIYIKGVPIHVKASLVYNYHINRLGLQNTHPLIRNGDRIRFLYLKKANPLRESVIAFIDEIPKEFALDGYIDYDMMFEKTFLSSIQNIADALDWRAEAHSSLEDFF